MGLLDWIKNRGKTKQHPEPEDEPAPDRYVTKRGNPIKVIQQGKWNSDHPGYESKALIGRSIEGYHGGREVSYGGGDGPVVWSNARPTLERAEKASYGISGPDEYQDAQPRERDLDPKAHGHENWKSVFAEMRGDEALAKRRDETGREPESGDPKTKPGRGRSMER